MKQITRVETAGDLIQKIKQLFKDSKRVASNTIARVPAKAAQLSEANIRFGKNFYKGVNKTKTTGKYLGRVAKGTTQNIGRKLLDFLKKAKAAL